MPQAHVQMQFTNVEIFMGRHSNTKTKSNMSPYAPIFDWEGIKKVVFIDFDTVKPVLSSQSKDDQKLVFNTDYPLLQVQSIAECSKGSILQYF